MSCENCSICLESLSGDKRELSCGHKFHTKCMRQWEEQNRGRRVTCPNCRSRVERTSSTRRPNPFPDLFSPPAGLNIVPPWLAHAQSLENAGMMAASDLMDNIELRFTRTIQSAEELPDFDTKIFVIVVISLMVLLGSLIGVNTINEACMCQHRWPPDATMITVDGWFGGTTTYHRPPMCTKWC